MIKLINGEIVKIYSDPYSLIENVLESLKDFGDLIENRRTLTLNG
jgi:hypothetical protein